MVINVFMAQLFGYFGLSWGFFVDYCNVLIFSSLLVHIVLLRYELRKKYPQVPYEQNWP